MAEKKGTASLTELVFEYRNKAYGSYQYRKKYLRTLFFSAGIGTFIYLAVIVSTFLYYLIREAGSDLRMAYIYEVEYIPFAPPEDIRLVELAKAHAVPPKERKQVPVVVDSVPPREEPPQVKELPEIDQEQPEESDSASYGTRGDETGRQGNTDTIVATTIDVYPRFPGGEEARLYWLRRHVSYPKRAVEQEIQGVVTVVFIIEIDGSVTHVRLLNGIGGGCDEEAVRVTREMPRWSPGKRSGRPVRVMVKMPIIFRLPAK